MRELLIRQFVKNHKDVTNNVVREQYGQMTSVVGIVVNLFLFISKFVVGTLAGSVSITGDAVNNLSDAGSSVVSLVSFKISGKPADVEHPFGHARIEYIAASVIAIVILLIGTELIRSSVNKILNPSPIDFNVITAAVLVFSIIAKLWLTHFNTNIGKRIGSTVMKATAADSLADVMATSAVLASAIIGPWIGIQLDGYMGIVVALFIMFSGLKILKETMDSILGQGPTEALIEQIETYIRKYEGVSDIHDLVAHNYGPNRWFASVHAEVDASVDIMVSHDLIDSIERDIAADLNIHLVIHMDPVVKDDPFVDALSQLTRSVIEKVDDTLTMHDFRVVKGSKTHKLIFEVTVPYTCRMSDHQILEAIESGLTKENHSLYAVITIDRSYLSSSNYMIKM
jgi:cation diffusion facilitator family transporter